MAQTGYTPILIYSSSTASNLPSASNLTNSTLGSELAINIADGKLFYKDTFNAVQVIGWKVTPTSAGGTGLTSYTAGDMLYYASGTALSKLAIGSSGAYMSSSGTAPQWTTPAALTKTDDTNVTLTLGGSASTALLNAASLTLGWTGTLAVARGGTGTGTAGITAFNNITGYTASGATGTTSTNLVFSTSPTLTTPSVTGDLTMSTGNVVMSNGKGIDFSATPGTGTSELFSDYEEGDWTPTIVSSGGGIGTYTTQTGKYTKIGRQVTITAYIVWTNHSGSGNMRLGNFPFTTASSGLSSVTIGYFNNITFTAGSIPVGWIDTNSTFAYLYQIPSGGGTNTDIPLDTAGSIMYSATYFV